jgi:putative heme-binding domain-containing protein
VIVSTTDGQVVTGRIVNLNGDGISINTNMLDPNLQVHVDRNKIEEQKPSPVSMMPEGLLNNLTRDEVLDLVAYLLSRGDRDADVFK